MKKKLIIELFIYIIVVVIGVILLLTSKPKDKPIHIDSDFKIEGTNSYQDDVRRQTNAIIPVQ